MKVKSVEACHTKSDLFKRLISKMRERYSRKMDGLEPLSPINVGVLHKVLGFDV